MAQLSFHALKTYFVFGAGIMESCFCSQKKDRGISKTKYTMENGFCEKWKFSSNGKLYKMYFNRGEFKNHIFLFVIGGVLDRPPMFCMPMWSWFFFSVKCWQLRDKWLAFGNALKKLNPGMCQNKPAHTKAVYF